MLPNQASGQAAEQEHLTLLEQVAFLGARPFASQVVQSPWNAVVDAPSLHGPVKGLIRTLVAECRRPDAARCLTVVAPAGYGKTHLLAWTRHLLDERNDAVFVYVPPYLPGSPGGVTLEQHVMRAAVDALWSRSRRQQVAFEQAVRSLLVGCYDAVVESGSGGEVRDVLRAGTFWSRMFSRSRLRIGRLGPDDQLPALQRAFGRRAFLERAFAEFCRATGVGADGVRPDWDAFVAACLQTCGDARQRWHAERWFRADRIPPDVLEPFHLDDPCQGTEKVRNGLFTLQRMVGQSFCLAFDQLEDTFQAVEHPGGEATRFPQLLGILLRNLSVMPGFCLLFTCQQSVWQDFVRRTPPMLFDRMVEGHGPQLLPPLDDGTAQELVRRRMAVAVWVHLTGGPPAEQPHFPFQAEEVHQMLIDSSGELRAFLQRAQLAFESRLNTPPQPRRTTRLRLTSVEPREVMSHEATALLIRGESLPAEVRVLFAGLECQTPPVCRRDTGEIDVTTPVGLAGDVEVRVEAADNPDDSGCVVLRFMERQVPRPYCLHIDKERLKKRRKELGLNQTELGVQVGVKQWDISNLETGKWTDAPDSLYARLAEVYGRPLSSFLKQQA